MRLSKIVTLLLAGFFTFGTLNSVAATKNAKTAVVKTIKKTKKVTLRAVKKTKGKKHKKTTLQASKFSSKNKIKKIKPSKNLHRNVVGSYEQSGIASYYADKFNGRLTASGERFSNSAMTAAHKTLPFGTLVEVTNLNNGRKVVVRINDRGPYAHARVIDLSKAAAYQLDMQKAGLAKVHLAVVYKNKKSTETVSEKS